MVARPDVSARRVLTNLKNEFKARGIRGLVGLQRNMRNEYEKLRYYSPTLNSKRSIYQVERRGFFRIFFDHLDASHFGAISHESLINAMRRPLGDKRLELVKRAFVHIARSVDDWGARKILKPTKIDAQKIAKTYDASRHPEVIAGTTSESNQLKEFLETFDCGTVEEGIVTLEEFRLSYESQQRRG